MRLLPLVVVAVALAACGEQRSLAADDSACAGHGEYEAQERVRACDRMLASYEEGSPGRAATLAWRARAKERGGDPVGALADYDAALAINPDAGGALLGRGRLLIEAGNFEAAEQTLLRSIEVHDSGIARDLLGGQALMRGDYQEALNYYEALIEADWGPGLNETGLYGRGIARLRLGDEAGREDIERAIQAYPTIAESFEERGIRP